MKIVNFSGRGKIPETFSQGDENRFFKEEE